MGLDLFTLNQIGIGFPEGSKIGVNTGCRDVVYQYAWQHNALSREEIAQAIAKAEDMIAQALTFYPAPKYIQQEQIQYPHRPMPYAYGLGAWSVLPIAYPYPVGYSASIQTRWHKVLGGGTRARTYIADSANLTLIDSTTGLPAVAPAINDMFTCTVAVTAGTLASELGVYFRAADRIPVNAVVDESWRIRPVTITVSGVTATISGHSALLVKPNLETIVNPEPLDVTDATIYVDEISLYRVYRDSDNSGNAYWEVPSNCNDDVNPPCSLEERAICIGSRNARMGQVFIGFTTQDEGCNVWRCPEKVTINYLAGEPLAANGQMQPEYAEYVAHLATGLLASRSCGCDRVDKIIEYWGFDVTDRDKGRQLTTHEMQSPFGFSRGALWVWERIQYREQITPVSV